MFCILFGAHSHSFVVRSMCICKQTSVYVRISGKVADVLCVHGEWGTGRGRFGLDWRVRVKYNCVCVRMDEERSWKSEQLLSVNLFFTSPNCFHPINFHLLFRSVSFRFISPHFFLNSVSLSRFFYRFEFCSWKCASGRPSNRLLLRRIRWAIRLFSGPNYAKR